MPIMEMLLLLVVLQPQTYGDEETSFSEIERTRILQHLMQPLPANASNSVADDPAAARLGQFLFYDTRFSANGEIACATCHKPALGFSDGLPRSRGLGLVKRHAQSLWNVAHQGWFFWDGRADSLWAQALAPIEDPMEMGFSRLAMVHMIYADPELRQAYTDLFGAMPDLADQKRFPASGKPKGEGQTEWDGMDVADQRQIDVVFANLGKSIEAFERRLVTSASSFDRFLEHLLNGEPTDEEDFPAAARRGLKLFVGKARCRLCHNGPTFSDGQFHNTGVPPLDGSLPKDPGRYEGVPLVKADPFNSLGQHSDDQKAGAKVRFLQRQPENWGQFKTPGLRNVAQSAPYMHQGQFNSLEGVVAFYTTLENQVRMGHHRDTLLVPLDLNEQEQADLVAFLKSLTADPADSALMQQPQSPR